MALVQLRSMSATPTTIHPPMLVVFDMKLMDPMASGSTTLPHTLTLGLENNGLSFAGKGSTATKNFDIGLGTDVSFSETVTGSDPAASFEVTIRDQSGTPLGRVLVSLAGAGT